MTASPQYTEYIFELLQPIGRMSMRRMFGGVGISYGAVHFAIIMGNSLYFTVDDSTRGKFEKAGMNPFSYVTKKGRIFVRSYFELPEDVLNDAESLRLWAIESINIADKKKKPKRSRSEKV